MPEPLIYLDHAATTAPDEAVVSAMADCMRRIPLNASAAYSATGEARKTHRLCRAQIAAMLGCAAQEVFFTSGGTEANNWAVKSFADSHMVISAIEHASVIGAARACAASVTLAQPDETGFVSPEVIRAAIRPDTKLICLQAANNETGVLQPIGEVYEIAKKSGAHLHVDAVAAFGHMNLIGARFDSMSLSAHKLYGPRGVGALILKNGAHISPLLHGGGQESGLRAGTENTPAICGFHAACQLAQDDLPSRAVRQQALLDAFCQELTGAVPAIRRLGTARDRLSGVCALLIPGMPAERLIAALDLRGVLISGGAACASRSGVPSHVYTAMNLSREAASCVVRISIGRHTTAAELSRAAEEILSLIPPRAGQNTAR